jgi:prepilin-type N-terminal cleavage/methylation domain-containing protein
MKRRKSNAFTLVELLVVIAIISILAAMLLPALENALDQAKRISCLSDRRQNYLCVQNFADDHDGYLPYDVANWNSGNRDATNYLDPYPATVTKVKGYFVSGIHNTASTTANSGLTGSANPLGVLAATGYVADPKLYFCPDYQRPSGFNELDKEQTIWDMMCDYNSNMPGRTLGISHYFFSTGTAYTWAGLAGPNCARINKIAGDWQKNTTSPMLISCANNRSGAFTAPEARSHSLAGVNGVFYDGMARWVDISEIDPTEIREAGSGIDHMSTCSGFYGKLQFWARGSLQHTN